MDILSIFNENFWAVATLVSLLTLPITNLLKTKLNPNNVWKQVISWTTSILLTIGAYFVGIVTFNEPIWLTIPATGIICGLCANGIYDIPVIKEFITKYFSVIPKK